MESQTTLENSEEVKAVEQPAQVAVNDAPLTTTEREEVEALSVLLLNGRSSAWQKPVKKGVVEPLKDEEGKQVYHKGIPVSRLVYKSERQVLESLRDLNVKLIALRKAKAEEAERKSQEESIKRAALEASGETQK